MKMQQIMLTASNGKHNVTAWRPSVCPSVCPVTVTHQEAACNAAIIHFGSTTRRTDILFVSHTASIRSQSKIREFLISQESERRG